MTGDHQPRKPLSVSAMADLLGFSRQHFHALVRQGVFPPPVYDVTTRRPMYVPALQERCLKVLHTGISVDGRSVMFNDTRRRWARQAQRSKRPFRTKWPSDARARRLVDQLAYLNVPTTLEQVGSALRAARADGYLDDDPGLLGYLVRRLGGDASGAGGTEGE